MKKITTTDFENSLYYIGSGYDIEPLLRFTHLTDIFIYVNLHLSFENISDWYDKQFDLHPDIELLEKSVDNSFDETTHFDLHPDYISHLTQPSFINKEKAESYYRAFNHAKNDPQWAIQYRLKRKSINREIKFLFLTTEGLASYIALSHNGKYAPKIITTIQTNVLEESEGLMNCYFHNDDVKKPDLWIRGFMPELPVSINLFGNEVHRIDNKVLNSAGVFPKVGLSFNYKWICGEFEYGDPTKERHCKGFITEDREKEISQLKFGGLFKDDTHQFKFGSIKSGNGSVSENDIVFVPKSISEKLNIVKSQVISWESLISHRYDYNACRYVFMPTAQPYQDELFLPVAEQLNLLHQELKKRGVDPDTTVHIIPCCLEDEGEQYAKTLSTWDIKTITYLCSPLDFIDLKE
jgi:hypothetical protein